MNQCLHYLPQRAQRTQRGNILCSLWLSFLPSDLKWILPFLRILNCWTVRYTIKNIRQDRQDIPQRQQLVNPVNPVKIMLFEVDADILLKII